MNSTEISKLLSDFMESKTHHYGICWNSLMTVIEKIESLQDSKHGGFTVNISKNYCSIVADTFKPYESSNSCYYYDVHDSDKQKATLKAVVGFINWYNINLKNKISFLETH